MILAQRLEPVLFNLYIFNKLHWEGLFSYQCFLSVIGVGKELVRSFMRSHAAESEPLAAWRVMLLTSSTILFGLSSPLPISPLVFWGSELASYRSEQKSYLPPLLLGVGEQGGGEIGQIPLIGSFPTPDLDRRRFLLNFLFFIKF